MHKKKKKLLGFFASSLDAHADKKKNACILDKFIPQWLLKITTCMIFLPLVASDSNFTEQCPFFVQLV